MVQRASAPTRRRSASARRASLAATAVTNARTRPEREEAGVQVRARAHHAGGGEQQRRDREEEGEVHRALGPDARPEQQGQRGADARRPGEDREAVRQADHDGAGEGGPGARGTDAQAGREQGAGEREAGDDQPDAGGGGRLAPELDPRERRGGGEEADRAADAEDGRVVLNHIHFRARIFVAVNRIEAACQVGVQIAIAIAREESSQRPPEHALVGRHPVDAQLVRNAERLL